MATTTVARLSLRDQEYLCWLYLRLSDTAIATQLHVTLEQVCVWQRRLCALLGCRDREALQLWVDGVRGDIPLSGLVVHQRTGQEVWLEQRPR